MSFEYRELTAQVFLGAGKGGEEPGPGRTDECIQCQTTLGCDTHTCDDGESPCGYASCKGKTDEDCVPCQTTLCQENTKPPDKYEYREALGLLRQQLRDTLAAG